MSRPSEAKQMPDHLSQSTPLAPGQRVAVFPFDEASGATLGYYGDIIAVSYESMETFPRSPEWWNYLVYVPAVRHEMVVRARDIVAFGQTARPERAQNVLEVRFDAPAEQDPEELRGVYRHRGGAWGRFEFRKQPQAHPTYQLRMSIWSPTEIRDGVLTYEVPMSHQLDCRYVLATIAEIMGEVDARKG